MSRQLYRIVLCAAAIVSIGHAAQSLVLTPGLVGNFTVPSVAPFTTLGTTRLEIRMHAWSVPTATTNVFNVPGMAIRLRSSGEVCALNFVDEMPDYGNSMCADINGRNDVMVRTQRDTTAKVWRLEVRAADNSWAAATYCGSIQIGTQGNLFPCPIRTVMATPLTGNGGAGGAGTTAQLAWAKWFSTFVTAGVVTAEYTPADLGDWRFEGNGNDSSLSALHIGGSSSYATSPVYPPGCSAGIQKSFRAGFPAALDGSGSYPVDGGSGLTYLWQQLTGPSRVDWSNRSVAHPTVTGLIFGSYLFQLAVTDSSGQTSTCTVKHGAVASDANGVVVTNNPAVDTLLGPLVRPGAHPWAWFDDRSKVMADMHGGQLSTVYGSPYWDIPGLGTVSVNTGSNTVVGIGTSFTTTFCQGPSNPTVPKPTAGIIVWYQTGTPGETGRRLKGVSSCTSDTVLTISNAWQLVPAGGGLSYSYSDESIAGVWIFGSAPANYYDNVAGFYAMYYRTGIDDYLNYARDLADKWWRMPNIDRGNACVISSGDTFCFPQRSLSTLGLVLRALDGKPEMWSGLHRLWDRASFFIGTYFPTNDFEDTRDPAYALLSLAYCGLYDTDPTYKSNCRTTINSSLAGVFTPKRHSDGGWHMWWASTGSWVTGSSASLTNGSSSVTGVGTNWNASTFSSRPVWFTNSAGSRPTSNAGGDPTTYTATFVSPTQITLDRPYQGTTGTHGWVAASIFGPVGWGSQPFSTGILATAFSMASKAIASSHSAGSALFSTYNLDAANWLKTYGYWPLRKGMYYHAQNANCLAPISDSNTGCTGGNGTTEARILAAETVRGVGAAYGASSDINLKTFGDTLFSAMFSKPGTGGPNPDGSYVDALDDGTGFFLLGSPPTGKSPKWFGMFYGFGNLASWPAYRVGGLAAEDLRTVLVGFNLSVVLNATQVRITAIRPGGKVTQTVCGSSPCAVMVNGWEGDHLIQMQYLSASGAVLAAGQSSVLAVR